jgi:hypothetical protein
MQSIFSNALSEAVAKHINLSVTRRETLSWLALLIMQHGTISLWRLAAYVASVAQTDSVRRRFYRFFQFVRLDGTLAARVVVELLGLGGKPWVLAIDRTNWDFGKTVPAKECVREMGFQFTSFSQPDMARTSGRSQAEPALAHSSTHHFVSYSVCWTPDHTDQATLLRKRCAAIRLLASACHSATALALIRPRT